MLLDFTIDDCIEVALISLEVTVSADSPPIAVMDPETCNDDVVIAVAVKGKVDNDAEVITPDTCAVLTFIEVAIIAVEFSTTVVIMSEDIVVVVTFVAEMISVSAVSTFMFTAVSCLATVTVCA